MSWVETKGQKNEQSTGRSVDSALIVKEIIKKVHKTYKY